jgi:hypothetical protein
MNGQPTKRVMTRYDLKIMIAIIVLILLGIAGLVFSGYHT